MSAFGSDCHFYFNATCLKGDTCPFRHCEAAKANDVTCTFWRQKTCIKPNCPYRHSEVVQQTRNRAEIPCYWEMQPIGCTKAACPFKHVKPQPDSITSVEAPAPQTEFPVAPDVDAVEVQPVVVNLAEDSDVEMASPVKTIIRDRTAVLDKPVRNLILKRPPETQQLISNVQKQRAVPDSKSNIRNRLTNQNPPTENRKSVKERLKLGNSNTGQQHSVKARLGVSKAETSVKNRLGTSQQQQQQQQQQQTPNSEESSPDDSDENSDVEVKSLEQIQREKALRSMGLMELKGGKIVKIADWEKDQKEDGKKSEEEKEEEEEESDESEKEEEKEISEEEEDDLIEPEPIELFAPDEIEEDTRTFISTENKMGSNSDSTLNLPQVEEGSKSRRIVVEDEVDAKTPVLKASLKRRLGGRITEVTRESSPVEKEPSVKKRLTSTVGSSNQGTIKTVTGIKSRLGTLGDDTVVLDARQRLKQKKMDNIGKITMSIPNKGDDSANKGDDSANKGDDSGDKPLNTASVRKRGWRKITKVTEDGTDTDTSRPVTPDRPLSTRSSPEKSSVTEEVITHVKKQKRVVDAGEQLQNLLTQKMRNNIWSNRKSKPTGETLDSLGIGIIDVKGGKVVKMSKIEKEEENRETKKEDKFMAQIEKFSKGSKKEVRERKVYVPPALQKSGALGLDSGDKRGRINYTESESALIEEDSNDIEVKTFSEIMAAKSQRQKRLSEKKSARKNSVEELPQENTEDSNEAPADVLKMAQMITGASASPVKSVDSHHHRSKKKSKWRKKHKASKEKKDSKENKHTDSVDESTQDTTKSCDTAISEDSQNSNLVSSQHASESTEPVLLKTKRQNSETGGNTSEKEEISPAKKRTEQLLSDSWLDLGEEDSEEVITQDEDDLLREIDELLA